MAQDGSFSTLELNPWSFILRSLSMSFLSFGLLLALSGCSGEPGEADMEKAVARLINETIEQTRQLMGNNSALQVSDFKGFDGFTKESCSKLEDNRGYTCTFSYTATIGGATETDKVSGRFYQTERGWVAELGT